MNVPTVVLLTLAPFFSSACLIEQRFIFFPDKTIYQTPANAGLVFEDVYFASLDGVRLNGWYIPYPGARTTLLWFHGNAGNISHRVENIRLLHDQVKINIFIFDYRAYGRSAGSISEAGTYLDGAAAIDLLGKHYHVRPGELVFFGRSLGAAIAAEMASRTDHLALILESPFVSIAEMARAIFPYLPLASVLSTQYDTLEKVQRVKSPLLVLHGDRDEVVPFSHGRRIFDAATEPKRFHTITGANHNNTYLVGGDAYFAALREAIDWGISRRNQARGDLQEKAGADASRRSD